MTEHLTGSDNQVSPNSWTEAFPVAEEINDVMKSGMSAYIWCYIVRFYGPISDGTANSGQKGDVTKKGYVMSQFSRFIRPGFYRVESETAPFLSGFEVTAYQDPQTKKLVIVAINSSDSQKEYVIRINENVSSFTTYTTSADKNCEMGNNATVSDGKLFFSMEPKSITTLISN
jgi:glucuronoarabinoxylan endo-1,4-beta-xylanase